MSLKNEEEENSFHTWARAFQDSLAWGRKASESVNLMSRLSGNCLTY